LRRVDRALHRHHLSQEAEEETGAAQQHCGAEEDHPDDRYRGHALSRELSRPAEDDSQAAYDCQKEKDAGNY
jgi:hypothetical protein